MSLFPTVLARERDRCSLSRPNWTGCGIVAWISTIPAYPNRISGLLNHHLAGSNLTGSLSWICPDEWGHALTSSVYKLYTINWVDFWFFILVRNGVIYSGFRVDKMHLLLGPLITLAGIVAILPTSGTPNVGSTSGHYPSGLPVVRQIHLDGLQRFLNALHYLLLVVVLHFDLPDFLTFPVPGGSLSG